MPVGALTQGREDLRLDARLLQFLRLTSSLLQHDPRTAAHRLAARSFAVTPLGPRVGLIEWVQDSVPLFQLFTDWQKGAADRDAAAKAEQGARLCDPLALFHLAWPPLISSRGCLD